MQRTFIQRAGLWATHSLGALLFTLVFAALFFVPCFLLVERYPKRAFIRFLRLLGVLSLVLAVVIIVALIASGRWERLVVMSAMFVVFMSTGAALGFFRAASHGAEVATLRPEGDAAQHWGRILQEHPRWWLRSRAARELGDLRSEVPVARKVLQASQAGETNRHVKRAVAESLRRLASA